MQVPSPAPGSLSQFWQAPLVWVALAATLGVVLDRQLSVDLTTSLTIVFASVVLWLCAYRTRVTPSAYAGGSLGHAGGSTALLFLTTALVGCGMIHHHLSTRRIAAHNDVSGLATEEPRPVQLTGTVASEPTVAKHADDPLASIPAQDSLRFVLKAEELRLSGDSLTVAGLVQVSMPKENSKRSQPETPLHYGDRVRVLGNLAVPAPPANPSDFDYAEMLRDQGIRTVLSMPADPGGLVVEEPASPISFFGWLGKIQAWARTQLETRLTAHQGVAVALLLGDGSDMTTNDWDKYFRTGVIHALAVSGQHLVVLAWFLGLLLWLGRVPRRGRALIITFILISYAFLTGGRPAAMRAAWMVAAFSGGIIGRRVVLPANAFALAWLGVVIMQPADIFTGGCQLSFVCVLVLLWALSIWPETTKPDPLDRVAHAARPFLLAVSIDFMRMVGWIYLVGLIVWLAIFPLLAHRFHLIPIAGLLIGPLVVFLSEWALIGGFLLLLSCAIGFPPLIWVTAWFTQTCLAGCECLVDLGVKVPGGYFFVPDLPAWWVALFYLALLPALTVPFLRQRWRWTIAGVLTWGLISCWLWWGPSSGASFRCTFLAVGHGGCTIIETSSGRVLIYDAGALTGPDLTRRHIAPFLWQRGYSRIDEVVLSHADADHFNGLASLLEIFPVRQITTTPSFADRNNRPVRLTLRAIDAHGIPVRQVKKGDRWDMDDVSFEVLHPPAVGPAGIENVRSLVLKVRQGIGVLLLTGDLQDEGMSQVLTVPAGRIDVLQSPHHGSKTSNTPPLADWARPQVVVSCQRRPVGTIRPANVFETRRIPYLGTWPHGAVTIRDVDGIWRVETYRTKETIEIREPARK